MNDRKFKNESGVNEKNLIAIASEKMTDTYDFTPGAPIHTYIMAL